jgi:5,10-methylenetetrahydromethanopterin reductase
LRFGLQLHGTLALSSYPILAARAEVLGFEDVTVHDVLMRRPVWPLLCDVARATGAVRVGPNVTHPYLQHPAVIAANVAHLDELSRGRAVLGLGRGSLYDLVGMPGPRGVGGLAEATRVIRALVGGTPDPIDGERFSLGAGAELCFGVPRVVPVYLGVFGEKGVRLAGRIADGVRAAAQWDPAYAGELRSWLAEAAVGAGRVPSEVDLVLENWTVLHPDRDLARREARRVLATFLPHLGRMLEFYGVAAVEVDAARRASVERDDSALELISDTTVDRFMAAGDGEDLRRGLDRIAAAGFDAVSFSGILGPDPELALEMLGDEIGRRRAPVEPSRSRELG